MFDEGYLGRGQRDIRQVFRDSMITYFTHSSDMYIGATAVVD